MPEARVVAASPGPLTVAGPTGEFRRNGLREGQTVLVHSSLSSLGWVAGGPVAVIEALLAALGPTGTLVMPSHSAENTEPSTWGNPAVPEEWWPIIRSEMPPFERAKTPTRGMGRIAEAFRSWPATVRSNHPTTSFTALGPHARAITEDHALEEAFGESSPLARLYDLDGYVLLLGVGHDSNSSLHLAEARASWPGKRTVRNGSAILQGGGRRWVEYDEPDWDSDDFAELGAAYEAQAQVTVGQIGLAPVRFLRQRPLVDFAVEWLSNNRRGRAPESSGA